MLSEEASRGDGGMSPSSRPTGLHSNRLASRRGMARLSRSIVVAALVLAFAGATSRSATPQPDIHELFEDRCGRCHGHAGAFARSTLAVVGDELRSRTRDGDIREFLARHYGGLSRAQTESLYTLFMWQVAYGGQFEKECGICHIRARELSRRSLIVDDGELRGRYTGNRIREFLTHHGRLDAAGVDFFYDVLIGLTEGVR